MIKITVKECVQSTHPTFVNPMDLVDLMDRVDGVDKAFGQIAKYRRGREFPIFNFRISIFKTEVTKETDISAIKTILLNLY